MKKRIFAITLIILLSVLSLPVNASGLPRLMDSANLLTVDEEASVLAKLNEVSEKHQMDIVVVTVDGITDGRTITEFADDYFDYNGYGQGDDRDGILLAVDMGMREAWMSTSGYCITAFTDAGIDFISEEVKLDMSGGFYEYAFLDFADWCDKFITQAKTDLPYDIGNMPEVPFEVFASLIIAVVVGVIIATVSIIVMRCQLISVKRQVSATNYKKSGSLNIVNSNEYFLYRNVNRIRRQTQSSSSGGSRTHTSSSGRTHGGGGFKF